MELRILAQVQLQGKCHYSECYLSRMMVPDRRALVPHAVLLLCYYESRKENLLSVYFRDNRTDLYNRQPILSTLIDEFSCDLLLYCAAKWTARVCLWKVLLHYITWNLLKKWKGSISSRSSKPEHRSEIHRLGLDIER